jgi:ParB-like chromosome segregation protein Spo0J
MSIGCSRPPGPRQRAERRRGRSAAAPAHEPAAPGEAAGPGHTAVPQTLASVVEWRAPGELRPDPRNARRHGDKQIHQLARAIVEFGFTVPILIDEAGGILAGHARQQAALRLGLARVPTLRLSGLSAAQRRAYAIAENRLAEQAGWDRDALRGAFHELVELGFEVELTGFETAEIDLLLLDADAADGAGDEDEAP